MSITIKLELHEAIVLFDFLSSKKVEDISDIPTRNALNALQCVLEKEMIEPFSKEYLEILKTAREALIDRYGP